jgi:hypothetical protein
VSPKKFFETQLEELMDDCLHGLMYFRASQRLNETFEKDANTIEAAVHFFVITSIAHLNSTKLHLFRIIDDAKELCQFLV